MSQHTPTPWNEDGRAVIGPREDQEICVCTADGADPGDEHGEGEIVVSEAEAYANAAFIVRCVNSHDALVKALEALHIEMDAFRQNAEVSDNTKRHWAKACDEARAALKLAKD